MSHQKLLEKGQVSYEKQANKSQRHIEFEVGDLVWLNINDFKMPETLANRFVAHPTFHVSKLKQVHEDKKKEGPEIDVSPKNSTSLSISSQGKWSASKLQDK
jgi:hypothetical protein